MERRSTGGSAGPGWRPGRAGAMSAVPLIVLTIVMLTAPAGCGGKEQPSDQLSRAEEAIEHYDQGRRLMDLGRYSEAIEQFRLSLDLNPNTPVTYYALAFSQTKVDDIDGAIASLDKVLEIKPDYADAQMLMGIMLNEKGQHLAAMERFRGLLDNPDYYTPWVAYYNLGFSAASAGNTEEALYYYKEALELKPDYVQARQQHALMLERLGRLDAALEEYLKVLDALPENPEIQFSLGKIYYQLGQREEAFKHFEWVMRFAPGTEYSAQSARYLNRLDTSGR